MEEDLVYLGAKKLLIKQKWQLLAGQPPDGCDHLPVVEIKAPIRTSKGSNRAYKPDLIAYKDGMVMLVECKPLENQGDIDKLVSILGDNERIENLYFELSQRNILRRKSIDLSLDRFKTNLIGAIAHNGEPRSIEILYVLHISEDENESEIFTPRSLT